MGPAAAADSVYDRGIPMLLHLVKPSHLEMDGNGIQVVNPTVGEHFLRGGCWMIPNCKIE